MPAKRMSRKGWEGVAQVSHGRGTFPFGEGRLEQAPREREPEGVMDRVEGKEPTHLARAGSG